MLPSFDALSLRERSLDKTGVLSEYARGVRAQRLFSDEEIAVQKEECRKKLEEMDNLRYEAVQQLKEAARAAKAAENAATSLDRQLSNTRRERDEKQGRAASKCEQKLTLMKKERHEQLVLKEERLETMMKEHEEALASAKASILAAETENSEIKAEAHTALVTSKKVIKNMEQVIKERDVALAKAATAEEALSQCISRMAKLNALSKEAAVRTEKEMERRKKWEHERSLEAEWLEETVARLQHERRHARPGKAPARP